MRVLSNSSRPLTVYEISSDQFFMNECPSDYQKHIGDPENQVIKQIETALNSLSMQGDITQTMSKGDIHYEAKPFNRIKLNP